MKFNEKGFMLLSTVFLTLIVSFVAMMTLQTMMREKNSDNSLKLQAINLANEQFALIESGSDKNIPDEDFKNYGLYRINDLANKPPTEFKVTTKIFGEGNLREVKVTVTWKDKSLEFEKIIRREE